MFKTALISAIFFACLPTYAASVSDYDLSDSPLVVGKDTDFLICSNELPSEIEISISNSAVARLAYLQPLKRCAH